MKGIYLRHTEADGFIYEYVCIQCGRKFKDTAPELSDPIVVL